MIAKYFVQFLFAVSGIISFLAAVLNWDWFFTSQNSQLIVQNVGRTKARLFYGILGVILMSVSVFFFFN